MIKDSFSHLSPAEKRALLAEKLRRKAEKQPLSFNQQSLFAQYAMAPQNAAYNTAFRFEIKAELDMAALEKALQEIVARHAVLRTTYSYGSDGAFQNVAATGTCDFAHYNAFAQTLQDVDGLCAKDAAEPFDLERGPVLRVRLYSLTASHHVLLVAVHHIAFDYWSGVVLQRELQTLYSDFRSGRPSSLPPLEAQYTDFVKWQADLLQKEQGKRLADYWLTQLSGELPLLNLPTDAPRRTIQSFEGKSYRFRMCQELVRRLEVMARVEGKTLYSLMLAAHAVLLHRYSGQTDFPVGTAAAGRNATAFENSLGFFVNTVVLRMDCTEDPPFLTFWKFTAETAIAAVEHQDFPFSLLIEKLGIPRDPSRSPLCDALFAWDKPHSRSLPIRAGDTEFTALDAHQLGGPNDLNFIVFEKPETLDVTLQYNTDLFTAATIERMAVHYENLLRAIAEAPTTSIGKLSMLSEQERTQLLTTWNDTATDYPKHSCVHQLFEEQAAAAPAAVAIAFEGRQITYEELNARANRIARFLKKRGVGPDVLVGVCLERSVELMVSLLAILKAGGAYTPLDAEYPADRLKFMVEDTRTSILLTHSSLVERFAFGGCELVCMDRDLYLFELESSANLPISTKPDDLAYVMYTSGSTGTPKGTCIPHRAIVRLVRDTNYMEFGPGEVLLQFSPVSFDASTLEIWGSLLNGGKLAVCAPGKVSLKELCRTIRDQRVTSIFLTSGLFQALVDQDLKDLRGLRLLLTGGDVMSVPHAARALTELPGCKLLNVYGPTENTTFSTFFPISASSVSSAVPIGRPISNTQTYILDAHLQPVPIGVQGDLYTGGEGLARGYWNRPELTAAAFVDHPFHPGAKLYKTGDMAKYLPDGEIAFLGRKDSQVKIRGFRIEIEEIEAALKHHENVRTSAVVVRGSDSANKQIFGYVVARTSPAPTAAALRAFLLERLPGYMVPDFFQVLDRLPISPTGKLDRQALPMPELLHSSEDPATVPATENECLIARVWTDALHVKDVRTTDNFFDLGGNSLLLMQVQARLQEAAPRELALIDLFRFPTLAGMARLLENNGRIEDRQWVPVASTEIPCRGGNDPWPIAHNQQQLWFADRITPGNHAYNVPVAYRLTGRLNVKALEQAFAEVINRHEPLRSRFLEEGGQTMQIPSAPGSILLDTLDLSDVPEEDRSAEAVRIVAYDACRPFDLASGPVMRGLLLRVSGEDHVFYLNIHHLVIDGVSLGILYRELSELYRAYSQNLQSPLSPLPVRFADFAEWQNAFWRSDAAGLQADYWKRRLAGTPATLDLPTDFPRPGSQNFQGRRETVVVPEAVTSNLRKVSGEQGVSLFMTLAAALEVLLYRYSGQPDFIIGFPVAGRTSKGSEGLIGLFVNLLPLRAEIDGHAGFLELLHRVRDGVLEATEHQDVAPEQIVEALSGGRDVNRTRPFQVVLSLNHDSFQGPELSGLGVEQVPLETGAAKFELTLEILESGGELRCAFEYDSSLFTPRTVDQMARHFFNLLTQIATDPDHQVSALHLFDSCERQELIWLGRGARTAYPATRSLHDLFEEHARNTPDAIAAIFGGDQISYGNLNLRANALARQLIASGIRAGDIVAASFERSIDLLTSLLAILKTGASYLPLDPAYPDHRLRFMVQDASVGLVLAREPLDWIKAEAIPALYLDEIRTSLDDAGETVSVTVSGEAPAYVMYTSGSTGQPKGVVIPHRAVTRMVRDTDYLTIAAGERVCHTSNTSFDAAIFEVWSALLNGATLVGLGRHTVLDPVHFAGELRRLRVNHVLITTALFNQIVRIVPDAFRTATSVMFGGEAADPNAIRIALEHGAPGRLLNMYGPTESTTYATCYRCDSVPDDAAGIPIGRPIANTSVYVLDQHLNPLPAGVRGELYIGGDGLALGYLNRPELTDSKFVADPFRPGKRLYATGDIGYFLPDGNIAYGGRKDHMVKIRGFRIELGEIETAIRVHPEVQDAIVLVREDATGDKCLVGYVASTSKSLSRETLKEGLARTLPSYMVPAHLTIMEALPVNQNGKLDRHALLALPLDATQVAAQEPETDLERTIARIWCDVVGVGHIGRQANFFDIGGHSLLLLRVQGKLQEALSRDVPIVDLFQYPTLSALAAHLGGRTLKTNVVGRKTPSRDREPIAIVGMAGRFPGAANVDEFWSNLRDGFEGIRTFSDEELLAAGVNPADFAHPNYVRAGAPVADPDRIDARFFGMNPREAEVTDPQHRVLLECAHAALENSGYDPHTYGGAVGVYVGTGASTYFDRNLRANDAVLHAVDPMQIRVGNGPDFVPTRISYKLNLRGPSLNIQTACSTSLVAVHLACRALREGDCDMALAGGVSIRFPQSAGYSYLEDSILSPDGHCRAFDAKANGTVAGNGAGIVVLKRLSAAVAAGDTIYAVIKGSAINNDGSRKVGFAAPGVEGQAEVIAEALADAAVDPTSISYVEAHGTGTALGDPIEVAALTKVFRQHTDRVGYCALGSVKTSVGHLDAAAGVTGLIKTVLQLRHRSLAPNLHFEKPNPKMDLDKSPFFVNGTLQPWRTESGVLRAGVSSFGIGGTNAHVIVEQAPEFPASAVSASLQVLPMSAKSEGALRKMAASLAMYLRANPETSVVDAAFTLQQGRTQHSFRMAVVGGSVQEVAEALDQSVHESHGEAASRQVIFAFPGQGSQYAGMGRGLYEQEPAFRCEVDACALVLKPFLGGTDLRTLLFPAAGEEEEAERALSQCALTQPALFVLEYALARLWMEWGVQPQSMIGHSVGEYVAACLAGVMSREDALRVVARRGQLMQQMERGAMLAVSMTQADAAFYATQGVSIAAINSSNMCVLSGPSERMAALEEELNANGIFVRRLRTSHAFHSAMMDPALEPFEAELRSVVLRAPQIPYISNVTGTWITTEQATSPEYWAKQVRSCVRFADGVAQLAKQHLPVFLEIGPGNTLATLIASQEPGSKPITSLAARKGGAADTKAVRIAAGRLWAAGASLDWSALRANTDGRRIALPTYPFERERFWVEPMAPASTGAPAIVKNSDISQWFYAPSWARGASVPARVTAAERCVLFADESGVAERIAEDLSKEGEAPFVVRKGASFARTANREFTVNPASPEDFRQLVAALSGLESLPQRFVFLWGITAGNTPVEATLDRGYYSALWLMQALAGESAEARADIVFVANGMFAVLDGESLDPVKSAVLGPCRVASQEFPGIRCRAVDMDITNGLAQASAQIRFECSQSSEAHAIAYRGKYRWTENFEQVKTPSAEEPVALEPQGVYVVTGGLGGVGLELAGYLARSAQARLVLLARTAFPPRPEWDSWVAQHEATDSVTDKIHKIRRMEQAGAEVLIAAVDLADYSQLAEAIHSAERRFGRIDGVIHAAGIAGGGLIQGQTKATSSAVFAAKIQGTVNLARAFSERPVDFFVLCSSQRSVIGVPGRVEYCAANAFLDNAAQASGYLPASSVISIAWDGWAESGMGLAGSFASGTELVPGEAAAGMTNREGVEVFRRLLANPRPCAIISTLPLHDRRERHRTLTTERVLQVFQENRTASATHGRPDLSTPYAAPESPAQQTLARIWSELFGIDRIGVNDNFFELGGDSVIALQIISRANNAGLHLTPRHMFEHQTIAALAAVETGKRASAPQTAVTGDVPLTPIQHWFFEQQFAAVDHFNLSLLTTAGVKISREFARAATRHVVSHHDALRLRFARGEEGVWRQTNLAADAGIPFRAVDLAQVSNAELQQAIEAHCTESQGSLSITQGPLFGVVLLECGPGRPDRLLLVIHHLACDLITLQILLQDFETAYQQLSAGQNVQLPPKTTSFQEWSKILSAQVENGNLDGEAPYWTSPERARVPELPLDEPAGGARSAESNAQSVSVSLTAGETALLLHEAPRRTGADVRSLLLTALVEALNSWTGNNQFLIDVEGLGRDGSGADVDLSRTAGWFTPMYPVYLDRRAGTRLEELPRAIHADLRAIPSNGVGYGALRYLQAGSAIGRRLAAMPRSEVSFLYRGIPGANQPSLFRVTSEPCGAMHASSIHLVHAIAVDASIIDGCLRMTWIYDPLRLRTHDAEFVAGEQAKAIRSLIQQPSVPASSIEADAAEFAFDESELAQIAASLGQMTEVGVPSKTGTS